MKIQSQKDFFSGLMFTAVGTAFAIGATHYNVGDAARMGPGYFPLMLGIVLGLLGLLVMASSLARGDGGDGRIGAVAWRPLTLIICANLAFGVLLGGLPSIGLPAMGLVLAIYALTFIASPAGPSYSFRTTLILATLLAIGSYLVFIVGLKLQFQVWPTFIS
ncbi:tripartite tricarboxylate transporter TctB family protein [Pseudacidovorax sp. RU35E]|uniref:tripartite tricarboxylate transporter TctB family protein n=1 Tax=Pseudacidovorax sp. RU35E TaxID=1907403 RepID=UPI000954A9F3|nr:tripartite tricarboxylate transporter TctB family protein [Pseudacidovorax sp. RU35E]SIR59247.1 Tripartite tricarboxylate transporter TctB family protein [Pseudacidovorax sp. RU35E]